MIFLLRICACLMLSSSLVLAAERPTRVVSMNLCTDQLVLMLADPQQIASITRMAVDPEVSVMHREALGIARNYGQAEEIMSFEPDLILAGTFSPRYTTALLEKLGYTIKLLPPADTLEGVEHNIRLVADALGHIERGEQMIDAMRRRARSMQEQAVSPRPRAVIYRTGGEVAGAPSLGDSVLEYAGFTNAAREFGLGPWGNITLEELLRSQLDVLVLDDLHQDAPSRGQMAFHHPALHQAGAGFQTVHLDGRSTVCGTPLLFDASADLLDQYRTESGQ